MRTRLILIDALHPVQVLERLLHRRLAVVVRGRRRRPRVHHRAADPEPLHSRAAGPRRPLVTSPRSTSAKPSSDPRWSRRGYLIASSTVAPVSSDGVRRRTNRKGLRGCGFPSKVTMTSLVGRQLRVSGSSHFHL